MEYFEVSAKTGDNIQNTFEKIASILYHSSVAKLIHFFIIIILYYVI